MDANWMNCGSPEKVNVRTEGTRSLSPLSGPVVLKGSFVEFDRPPTLMNTLAAARSIHPGDWTTQFPEIPRREPQVIT
jgi:hypothetical protein